MSGYVLSLEINHRKARFGNIIFFKRVVACNTNKNKHYLPTPYQNQHNYTTQLYKSFPFSDLQLLVQSIETCSGNVKKLMTDNKLKMYNEKTEILLCSPKKYVKSSDCDHICIEGENISFSDNARNLGVYFDCTFLKEHHVKNFV